MEGSEISENKQQQLSDDEDSESFESTNAPNSPHSSASGSLRRPFDDSHIDKDILEDNPEEFTTNILRNKVATLLDKCDRLERQKKAAVDLLAEKKRKLEDVNESFEGRLKTFECENQKLRAENDRLVDRLNLPDKEKSLFVMLQQEVADLKKKLEESEQRCTDACEEIQELRQEVSDGRLEMLELHDQFREDEAVEFREIQKELESTAKNCRILQFKLRKAEKRCEQLELDKRLTEEKRRLHQQQSSSTPPPTTTTTSTSSPHINNINNNFNNNVMTHSHDGDDEYDDEDFERMNNRLKRRVIELVEELKMAKEVSVRLHDQIEEMEEKRGDYEREMERLRSLLDQSELEKINLKGQLENFSNQQTSKTPTSLPPLVITTPTNAPTHPLLTSPQQPPPPSPTTSHLEVQLLIRDLNDSLERENDMKEQLKFGEEEIIVMRKKMAEMEEELESVNHQLNRMTSSKGGVVLFRGGGEDGGMAAEAEKQQMKLQVELAESESRVLRRRLEDMDLSYEILLKEVKQMRSKITSFTGFGRSLEEEDEEDDDGALSLGDGGSGRMGRKRRLMRLRENEEDVRVYMDARIQAEVLEQEVGRCNDMADDINPSTATSLLQRELSLSKTHAASLQETIYQLNRELLKVKLKVIGEAGQGQTEDDDEEVVRRVMAGKKGDGGGGGGGGATKVGDSSGGGSGDGKVNWKDIRVQVSCWEEETGNLRMRNFTLRHGCSILKTKLPRYRSSEATSSGDGGSVGGSGDDGGGGSGKRGEIVSGEKPRKDIWEDDGDDEDARLKLKELQGNSKEYLMERVVEMGEELSEFGLGDDDEGDDQGSLRKMLKCRDDENDRLEEEVAQSREDMYQMIGGFKRRESELREELDDVTSKYAALESLLALVKDRAEVTQKELERLQKAGKMEASANESKVRKDAALSSTDEALKKQISLLEKMLNSEKRRAEAAEMKLKMADRSPSLNRDGRVEQHEKDITQQELVLSQKQLKATADRLSGMKEKLSQLEEDHEKLLCDHRKLLREEPSSWRWEKLEMERQMKELRRKLDESYSEMRRMKVKWRSVGEDRDRDNQIKAELEKKIEKLKEENDELLKRIEFQHQLELNIAIKDRKEAQQEVDHLNELLVSKDHIIHQKNKLIEQKDYIIAEKEKALKENAEATIVAEVALKNVEEQMNLLKNDVKTLEVECAQISTLKTQLQEKEQQLKQLDEQVRRRDDRLKEKDDFLQQINRKLIEKGNQVSDMDRTIRQIIRKLQARDCDLGMTNAELRRVQNELRTNQEKLQEAKAKLDALEMKAKLEVVKPQKTVAVSKTAEKAAYDDVVRHKLESVQLLEDNLKMASIEIIALTKTIEDLKSKLNSKTEESGNVISDLEMKVKLAEEKNHALSLLYEKNVASTAAASSGDTSDSHNQTGSDGCRGVCGEVVAAISPSEAYKQMMREKENLIMEKFKLNSELNKVKKQNGEREQEIVRLNQEIEKMKVELNSRSSKGRQQETSANKLEVLRPETLPIPPKKISPQSSPKLPSSLSTTTSTSESTSQTIAKLRSKVIQLETHWKAEKCTLEEFYDGHIQQLRETNKQLQSNNQLLRKECDGQLLLLQNSRKALADLRQRFDISSVTWNEEKDALKVKVNQVNDLQEQLKVLEKSNEDYFTRLEASEVKRHDLEVKLSLCEALLKREREKFEERMKMLPSTTPNTESLTAVTTPATTSSKSSAFTRVAEFKAKFEKFGKLSKKADDSVDLSTSPNVSNKSAKHSTTSAAAATTTSTLTAGQESINMLEELVRKLQSQILNLESKRSQDEERWKKRLDSLNKNYESDVAENKRKTASVSQCGGGMC
ncbi:hypothetical protein HELRODRAFT_178970 [Helobdella robusta]|uniref:Uncharacterized protein n=1 Tax=Helobdella robusta TaxID=6412 RepID=T1FDZ6_HELRO|nr:hypothetical protein HELRODRAFT_178970 [Helobdella robusta]ESN95787.1 hypothetical protein HELRODRAFT_178970 [Helobdella robusta]